MPWRPLGLPMGLRETDEFFKVLEDLAGRITPDKHAAERGRLIDAYVDGHKYIFDKRAVVLRRRGPGGGPRRPSWRRSALSRCCAPPAGKSGRLAAAVDEVTAGLLPEPPVVREGVDFYEIAEEAEALAPDLLIGHSKGYHLAKRWQVPLVRVGFPIHDRFGGPRILHLGYRGAQNLLDLIVNAMIEQQAGRPARWATAICKLPGQGFERAKGHGIPLTEDSKFP